MMFPRRPLTACIVSLILPWISNSASAAVQLPHSLTKSDRTTALQVIGFGTSSKILTDPYPLGGYEGFEAGFELSDLPVEDLGRLGAGIKPPQQDVTISKIDIGKGVYNNLDFFFEFTPYNQEDQITEYGGILRWGFYQATSLPLSLSMLAHFNSADIANEMIAHTYGLDLIGGVNVDNVSLFAGLGAVNSSGTFVGGDTGVTDSKLQESEFVAGTHTVVGADLRYSNIFVALQIDRYTVPVYSGKLGVRF